MKSKKELDGDDDMFPSRHTRAMTGAFTFHLVKQEKTDVDF